jgi:hypothetical protein
MEARPPAQNRHGGAPRGERVPLDARRASLGTARRAPKRATTDTAPFGAPPAPHGADGKEKSKTRARKRAAGTKKTALFDIVNRNLRQRARPRAERAKSRVSREPSRVPAKRAPRRRFYARCRYARASRDPGATERDPCRLCCALRFLRWVHASRVYSTCARLRADLGQARDRCLAEFTLGPREARTRGLARDTRAGRHQGSAPTIFTTAPVKRASSSSAMVKAGVR